MEWTPSLGVTLRMEGAVLHYSALITTGTGRPGVRWAAGQGQVPAYVSGVDVILAPEGPLTLQDARVTTHQLSVVIPIR